MGVPLASMASLRSYSNVLLIQYALVSLHSFLRSGVLVGSQLTEETVSSYNWTALGLATALFCWAIDWIMTHMLGLNGITVDNHKFTNLDYADDITQTVSTSDDVFRWFLYGIQDDGS
jgi:hypothetical protein